MDWLILAVCAGLATLAGRSAIRRAAREAHEADARLARAHEDSETECPAYGCRRTPRHPGPHY